MRYFGPEEYETPSWSLHDESSTSCVCAPPVCFPLRRNAEMKTSCELLLQTLLGPAERQNNEEEGACRVGQGGRYFNNTHTQSPRYRWAWTHAHQVSADDCNNMRSDVTNWEGTQTHSTCQRLSSRSARLCCSSLYTTPPLLNKVGISHLCTLNFSYPSSTLSGPEHHINCRVDHNPWPTVPVWEETDVGGRLSLLVQSL